MSDDLWIVVPVGPRGKYLDNLLNKLKDHHGRIIFVNNSKNYTVFDGVHHVEDFGDINIQRWWNKGIDFAKENGAKYVAILNDDIDFNEDFISKMLSFHILCNNVITDTNNSGNGGGAAWILSVESGLRLNESMRWWYGDTEIFDRAKNMNAFSRYTADYFHHFEPNNQMIELGLGDIVQKDAEQYNNITH